MSPAGRVQLAIGAGTPLHVSWELPALREIAAGGDGEMSWTLEGDPTGSPLLRVVSAALEDGTVLGLAALRPESAGGHGDEDVAAFIARDDGEPQEVLEARLSTEYDAAGKPRRAGLELWIDESGPPARGAGNREGAVEVRRGGLAGEAVRMGFLLDGVPGLAVYEILRPAT